MKERKGVLIVAVLLAALAAGGLVPLVLAQAATPSEVPSIERVLGWIAGGLAGPVLALALERSAWFQKIKDHRQKWYLIIGLNAVASLAAVALLRYVPDAVWTELTPYWTAVALMVINLLGSQVTHWFDKWAQPPAFD